MPVQHKHGELGEEYAAGFLTSKGYEILERNWRIGQYEIDLIVRKDGILIFVEVKTRSYDRSGGPEGAMTLQQWDRIAHAGGMYMREIDYDWEVRFDIVSVRLFRDGHYEIKHYRDVFFPGR